MEEISAVILCYNDEERIEKLINSLKSIKDIVISIDDNSTDKTEEIALKMGARVVKRTDYSNTPSKKDIEKFTQEFGFKPSFTEKKYFMWSAIRNEAASYALNDWVFFPDSDEFVEWDLDEVSKLLDYDQIEYKFISSPEVEFTHCKLYRKSRCNWSGDIHEVVVPIMKGTRTIFTDKIKLRHEKAIRSHRNDYLGRLEYSYYLNRDIRTLFYLSREYFYRDRYEDSIKFFEMYLKNAWWNPEICEAHYFKAQCLWKLQRGDEARGECFEAVHLNPDFKRGLELLSEMHYSPWREKWKRIADNATNQDVVFG